MIAWSPPQQSVKVDDGPAPQTEDLGLQVRDEQQSGRVQSCARARVHTHTQTRMHARTSTTPSTLEDICTMVAASVPFAV